MLQKSTTSDNENSFYVNLLQVIGDDQQIFLDVEQFDSIDLCFKVVSDSTLMEESNLRKTFSLFYNCIGQVCKLQCIGTNFPIDFQHTLPFQNERSIEVISVISILIENVLTKLTEEIVLEETRQYLQERMESIRSDPVELFAESIFSFIKFTIDSQHWYVLAVLIANSFKLKENRSSSSFDQETWEQHTLKLLSMLLKNRFGVGNFTAIKDHLSFRLSDDNFITTSISKLHSSLLNAFIEFLFTINYDALHMLNILVNSDDTAVTSCQSNVMNAIVSVGLVTSDTRLNT